MAMNKKEQAEMEALRKELRLAKALRWTEPVATDVPPPPPGMNMRHVSGFVFNEYNLKTEPAWSTSVYHGKGYSEPQSRIRGSQNSIHMYSSELLALKAMRNAVEKETAERLAKIDARIEHELAKQPTE